MSPDISIVLPYPYPVDDIPSTGLIGGMQTRAKYYIEYLSKRYNVKTFTLGTDTTQNAEDKTFNYFGNYLTDKKVGFKQIRNSLQLDPPNKLLIFLSKSAGISYQLKIAKELHLQSEVYILLTITTYISSFTKDEIQILKNITIIVQNTIQKDLLIKRKIPSNNIKILPNPIDTKIFRKGTLLERIIYRYKYQIKFNEFVILLTSRLIKEKGIETMIRAIKKLQKIPFKATFLFVGSDDKDINYKRYMKELEILNSINPNISVETMGKQPIQSMSEFYKLADMFILNSLIEGMSNSLLEAMASKLPIIASAIDENLYLIRNKFSGLTYRYGNSNELVKLILYLRNNGRLRRNLSKEARKQIKGQNNIFILKRLENILFPDNDSYTAFNLLKSKA